MIILICLIAERFLLDHIALRNNSWFITYNQWFERHQPPQRMRQGVIGMLLLILPPLLVLWVVQYLFEDALFGLLWLLATTAILLYCLGPQDLDSQVNRYIEAVDSDDDDGIRACATALITDEPPTSEPARSQAVAEGILYLSNHTLFSVLFWFVLLGPIGAMLYRITTWLPAMEQAKQDPDFLLDSKQLIVILDWIPARITAFCYAIAGSFEDALYGWRSYHESRFSEFENSNTGTLICTGGGAMRLSTLINEAHEGVQSFSFLAKSAMALVWRSLVVYLVVIALLTLIGLT
jgi:membrane protein required for beta-lactamase induction